MICRVTSHVLSSRPPQAPTTLFHRSASKVPIHHFQILKMMIWLLLSGLWSFPPLWPNPTDPSLFSAYLAVSSSLDQIHRHFSILSLFGGILFSGALSSLSFCHIFLSPDFPYLSGSFLFLHCCLCLLSVSHVTITQGSVLFSLSSCLPPFLPFLNMLTPGGLIIPNV